METASLVSKSVLTSGELAEVRASLGDNIVVELEDDATLTGSAVDSDLELAIIKHQIRIARSECEKPGFAHSKKCRYARRR